MRLALCVSRAVARTMTLPWFVDAWADAREFGKGKTGNDHISHQTGKGGSSFWGCRLGGDMICQCYFFVPKRVFLLFLQFQHLKLSYHHSHTHMTHTLSCHYVDRRASYSYPYPIHITIRQLGYHEKHPYHIPWQGHLVHLPAGKKNNMSHEKTRPYFPLNPGCLAEILILVYWLVVEPTHLQNMLVKLEIFPNFRGENKKIFELPPPSLL